MGATEVLILFHCSTGAAESMALAAAVGAVQARAMIRFRRMPDAEPTIGSHAGADDPRVRMCKEYVPPAEADLLRADGIVFVAPSTFAADAPEWKDCLQAFTRLNREGKLAGKFAAVLGETIESRDALLETIRPYGFTVVADDSGNSTKHGQALASRATAARTS